MQKSKRGRALFDKLSDGGEEIFDSLRQETRWGRGKARQTSETEESPLRLVRERDRFVEGDTWFCMEHGRLMLGFSPKAGAIGLFVLCTLFLVTFLAGKSAGKKSGFAAGFSEGRTSFESEALSEIEIARAQPPAEHLVEDLLPAAPAHAADAVVETRKAAAPSWVRGHTYIVAQEFGKDHEADARKARQYLATKGIETAVVRFPSGRVQLITLRGFDRGRAGDKKDADNYLSRLRKAGKQYFESGGRYKLEGYFKKLTGDAW